MSIARICGGSSSRRATLNRPQSNSNATLATVRRRCTTCAICFRLLPKKGTCGRWCTCCIATSAATVARKPRRFSNAVRAMPTIRAFSARSMKTPDWLAFFMFTHFTDRDGKFQLNALAESGFAPLARTTQFMLTEEAYHMFVGESGVSRVIQRTCDVMNQLKTDDPAKVRAAGAIDLPTIQRYLNFHYSVTIDLFGLTSLRMRRSSTAPG